MKFPQHNYQLVTQDFDCYIWFIWSSEHQVLEYAEIMIHYNVTGHWPGTGLSGIDKIVINSTQDLLVGKLVINIQIDIVYVFIGGIECLVHYILGSCRFGGRVMAARTWRLSDQRHRSFCTDAHQEDVLDWSWRSAEMRLKPECMVWLAELAT